MAREVPTEIPTTTPVIAPNPVFKDEPVTLSEENFEKEMIKLIFELQARVPDLGNRLKRCDILISKSGDAFRGVRFVSGDKCGIGLVRMADMVPNSLWEGEGISPRIDKEESFVVASTSTINGVDYPIILFPELGQPLSSEYLLRVLGHEGYHLSRFQSGFLCGEQDLDCDLLEEESAYKIQFSLLEGYLSKSGNSGSVMLVSELNFLALSMEKILYSHKDSLASYLKEIGYGR